MKTNDLLLRPTLAALLLLAPLMAGALEFRVEAPAARPSAGLYAPVGPSWSRALDNFLSGPAGAVLSGPAAALKGVEVGAPNGAAALAPVAAFLGAGQAGTFSRLSYIDQRKAFEKAATAAQAELVWRYESLVRSATEPGRRAPSDPRLADMLAQLKLMRSTFPMYFSPRQLAGMDEASKVLSEQRDAAMQARVDRALSRHRDALQGLSRPAAGAGGGFTDFEPTIGLSRGSRTPPALNDEDEPPFAMPVEPALSPLQRAAARLGKALAQTPDRPWLTKRAYAGRLLKTLEGQRVGLVLEHEQTAARVRPAVDAVRAAVLEFARQPADKSELYGNVQFWARELSRLSAFGESRADESFRHWLSGVKHTPAHLVARKAERKSEARADAVSVAAAMAVGAAAVWLAVSGGLPWFTGSFGIGMAFSGLVQRRLAQALGGAVLLLAATSWAQPFLVAATALAGAALFLYAAGLAVRLALAQLGFGARP